MYKDSNAPLQSQLSLASPVGSEVAAEALAGLSRTQKTLPPKLFYDSVGCDLFRQITDLPEYYLTRTERKILEAISPEIASVTPRGTFLVEYGASDETKALHLLRQRCSVGDRIFTGYVPIDIAAPALTQLAARLRKSDPLLQVYPVAADFLDPVALPRALAGRPRLGFFPGSTIGNFDLDEVEAFLLQTRETLGRGARMLVGVDLRKDPDILLPAYNDADGVTAAFNLNVLARLNREAGASFDLDAFAHDAVWNDRLSRIEMHLVSRRPQVVRVAGREIGFAAGESIHTENSYKHTLGSFRALAEVAGWCVRESWTDPDGYYALQLLE
jgi:dimethylhistidine N-methyltransferase